MTLWRINLKPGSESGIDARQHCLTKGLVGIGWQVNYGTETITAEFYERKATKDYRNKGDKGWWPAWNALYYKSAIDDLIWTRDWDGIYYVGRIIGEWYYDTSKKASQADIVNVKKCDWIKVGTIESVPGKLVNCFIPSRTIQQVYDETVNLFSQLIYNEKSSTPHYKTRSLAGQDLYSLLSSDDCEDALALYLQLIHNYVVVPSSCKSDTMAYEYVLIQRKTKENAIVQVKNGDVDLNGDEFKNLNGTVFLFTTKGKYHGEPRDNIKLIDPDVIKEFLYDNIDLLPYKMKIWVKLILP